MTHLKITRKVKKDHSHLSIYAIDGSKINFIGHVTLENLSDTFFDLNSVVSRKGMGDIVFNIACMFSSSVGKSLVSSRSGLTNEYARAQFDRLLASNSEQFANKPLPVQHLHIDCLCEDEEPFESEKFSYAIIPTDHFTSSIIEEDSVKFTNIKSDADMYFDRAYNWDGSCEIDSMDPLIVSKIDDAISPFKINHAIN